MFWVTVYMAVNYTESNLPLHYNAELGPEGVFVFLTFSIETTGKGGGDGRGTQQGSAKKRKKETFY